MAPQKRQEYALPLPVLHIRPRLSVSPLREHTTRGNFSPEGKKVSTPGAQRTAAARRDVLGDKMAVSNETGRAICCSGGGIRAAAFNLGALQELGQEVDIPSESQIYGVSGGAAIAASYILLRENSEERPFRSCSTEEEFLRDHSRYVVPDPKASAVSLIRFALGLAFNLVFMFASIFLVGYIGGVLARWFGILVPSPSHHLIVSRSGVWWLLSLITIICLAGMLPARIDRNYRPASLARVVFSVCAISASLAIALVLLPVIVSRSQDLGSDGTAAGVLICKFAAGRDCYQEQARDSSPPVEDTTVSSGQTNTNFTPLFAGVGALAAALAGAIRGAVGPVRGTHGASQASNQHRFRRSLSSFFQRQFFPFLGILILTVAGLIVTVFAVGWAAYYGFRPIIFIVLLATFFASRLIAEIGRNVTHSMYMRRLATSFPFSREQNPSLPKLSAVTPGRPTLRICASSRAGAYGKQPSVRGPISVIFDSANVTFNGIETSNASGEVWSTWKKEKYKIRGATQLPMIEYQKFIASQASIFDLVAASGARFVRPAGKWSRKAQRFLFAIANLRLGMWIPNPKLANKIIESNARRADSQNVGSRDLGWKERILGVFALQLHRYSFLYQHSDHQCRHLSGLLWSFMTPTLRMLLAESLDSDVIGSSSVYMTAGSRFDSLGLVEALRDRPSEVFVIDACGDEPHPWEDLGRAIRIARAHLGAEVEVDVRPTLDPEGFTKPWVSGKVTYRDNDGGGRIWICKIGLWREAPTDVIAYARSHDSFPTTGVLPQFRDATEFEAHRALGCSAMRSLLEARARGIYD